MALDELKRQARRSPRADENALSLAQRPGLVDPLVGAYVRAALAQRVRRVERSRRAGIAKVCYEPACESVDDEGDRRWRQAARPAFEVYGRVSPSGTSARETASALVGATPRSSCRRAERPPARLRGASLAATLAGGFRPVLWPRRTRSF
jgi:hypothetical protein